MRTIYRLPLPIRDLFTLELPLGSKFLAAECQLRAPHEPSMWFIVDPDRDLVTRAFAVIGTGNSVPEYVRESAHLATFQMLVGQFVWHLFEVPADLISGVTEEEEG